MAATSEALRGPVLRLGWTVGPWHCGAAAAQDVLALVELTGAGPRLLGKPWSGDLTDLLRKARGRGLLDALVGLAAPEAVPWSDLVIAVDAPLGLPDAAIELAVMGLPSPRIAAAGENRYLLRETEIVLARRGFAVASDMGLDARAGRGSKALHLVRAAGLDRDGTGVWLLATGTGRARAIETHPAVLAAAPAVAELRRQLAAPTPPRPDDEAARRVGDALACALLAHLWADRPGSCEPVPEQASLGEGWIMVPAGIGG